MSGQKNICIREAGVGAESEAHGRRKNVVEKIMNERKTKDQIARMLAAHAENKTSHYLEIAQGGFFAYLLCFCGRIARQKRISVLVSNSSLKRHAKIELQIVFQCFGCCSNS